MKRYFPTETECVSIIVYEILDLFKISFLKIPYSEIKCPYFETKNDCASFYPVYI